ncbi:MAG: hypothetical protein PS018_20105 [bacterium]|nr:hypothetical protein [bacterium]
MNIEEFSLTAQWTTPPVPEKRDVARIRLAIDGDVLTRISDFERKEERDYVRASAVSLALWLADNWWRLRYESLPDGSPPSTNWRLRHELTSASGGTVWPPIMIHSTGERVLLTPSYARPMELGAIRYVLPEIKSILGRTFETGLDRYFDQVRQACMCAVDGKAFVELVETIRRERADPEVVSWRRTEARLGYDPDTVPVELMHQFSELEEVVGEAAIDEAAAATPGKLAGKVLQETLEAATASEVIVDFSAADALTSVGLQGVEQPPWQLGKEAAQRVRQAIGNHRGPIRTTAFSELLRTSRDVLGKRGTASKLPYSARLRCKDREHKVALQSANQRDRRFELSCALADTIWAKSDFGVISRAKTDRQKFQRAFAQNFLAPYEGVREYIDPEDPTKMQIQQAAEQFHVHPNVISRLLMLEKVLPEETFEERLEAA